MEIRSINVHALDSQATHYHLSAARRIARNLSAGTFALFSMSTGATGSSAMRWQDEMGFLQKRIYLEIKVFEMTISTPLPFLISVGGQRSLIGVVSPSE